MEAEEDKTPAKPTLEEALRAVRGDFREGSQAALKAQLEAAIAYANMLAEQPFDPATIPGLLEPKAPEKKERKRSQTRIDVSEGGSMTMRSLYEKSQDKKAEAKRLQAIADDKREAAARSATTLSPCPCMPAVSMLCVSVCAGARGPRFYTTHSSAIGAHTHPPTVPYSVPRI